MALAPKLLKQVADDIADALTTQELEGAVLAATGNGLFKEYATENDPPRRAAYRTLTRLEEEGTERWFLTYVLVRSTAKDELRRTIVKACPAALIPQLAVDAQVQKVIETLASVKAAVLKPDYVEDFKTKSAALAGIAEKIATLFAYKSLHESLHALQLQLSYRPIVQDAASREAWLADLANCHKKITLAEDKAIAARAQLPSSAAATENQWIEALNGYAAQLQSHLAALNLDASGSTMGTAEFAVRLQGPRSVIEEVASVARQQLVRLNQRIFDAANDLSLEELIEAVPDLVQAEDCFEPFQHSIRDLSPTVLARTLVHKIWQDTDRQISLIEGVLDVATADSKHFREHWISLRLPLLWLASLDSQAEWSINATKAAKRIDEKLMAEATDREIQPLFDDLRSFAKYRFFAVDEALKMDCSSLGRIDEPLKLMLEEIRNA